MANDRPDMQIECSSLQEKIVILELLEKVTTKIGYWPNKINSTENETHIDPETTLSLQTALIDGKSK